jgi:hypothetical protein
LFSKIEDAMKDRPLQGLYLITDDSRGERLQARVAAALQGGTRIVQYRGKQVPVSDQRIHIWRWTAGPTVCIWVSRT